MSMDVWLEVEAKEFVVIKEMVGVVDCPWERQCVCTASQLAAAARPCDSRSLPKLKTNRPVPPLPVPPPPLAPCFGARTERIRLALPFPRRASHFSHQIEGLALLASSTRPGHGGTNKPPITIT